jgi:ATP-dependent helicase/DNAse subunit B
MGNERMVKYTTSMVKCFKQCRKKYFLEYVEELKPIQTPAALHLGTLYHRGLELLLQGMDIPDIGLSLEADQRNHCLDMAVDYDPIPAGIAFEMVRAFYLESGYQNWKINKVEQKFEVSTGYGKRLTGKIDAIMEHEEKDFLVEHKSTSRWASDGAEYLHGLLWDEQSTNYLYAYRELYGKPAAGIMYVIVEKPTIKPLLATPVEKRKYKQDGTIYGNQREEDETPEEYLKRVAAWYMEKSRVHIHFVYRTPADINAQIEDLNLTFKDMAECEKNETYYRNPGACSILDCPYRPKCLDNMPDTDCLFVRKKARNEELA